MRKILPGLTLMEIMGRRALITHMFLIRQHPLVFFDRRGQTVEERLLGIDQRLKRRRRFGSFVISASRIRR